MTGVESVCYKCSVVPRINVSIVSVKSKGRTVALGLGRRCYRSNQQAIVSPLHSSHCVSCWIKRQDEESQKPSRAALETDYEYRPVPYCMSERGLRQRAPTSPARTTDNNASNPTHTNGAQHMAYGRSSARPVIASRQSAVSRAGSGGGGTSAPSTVSSSYRNKIVTVLLVTIVYTAFLYRSGQCSVCVYDSSSRH